MDVTAWQEFKQRSIWARNKLRDGWKGIGIENENRGGKMCTYITYNMYHVSHVQSYLVESSEMLRGVKKTYFITKN